MGNFDPKTSVEFLRSGPTLSYDIFVFRFYEAAVRELRQSAIKSHPMAKPVGPVKTVNGPSAFKVG